eukprot:Hpha_TRINITY_DN16702_c3_g1::TRINITY_DN16702_c3_g1_i1::g.76531::m.76531
MATPAEKAKLIFMQKFAEVAGPGSDFEIAEGSWPVGFPGHERTVRTKCFVRCPRVLREYFERFFAEFARRDFIIFRNERHSFAHVWQQVSALGAALTEDFGVKSGDRVACAMRNSPEWVITFLAATSIGAVIVPTNSWWQREELEYGLKDSGANVLLCDDLVYGRIAGSLAGLGVQVVLSRPAEGTHGLPVLSDVIKKHWGKACPDCPREPDSPAVIMYTSGTTGRPKGVVQTHRGVCNQLWMHLFGRAVRDRVMKSEGILAPPPPQPCAICPVPLFHVSATHHMFLSSIGIGGKVVLMEKWEAGEALKLIERERATRWTAVPTMVRDMMEHPNFSRTDVSSVTDVGSGGASVPPSYVGEMQAKFNAQPHQAYGLTETNGVIAINNGADYLARRSSTGQAFPIVEVLVADLDTQQTLTKPRQRGELLIRSPLVLSHYWNKKEATNATVVEVEGKGYGWLRTGDVAEVDEEGFIYICDRAKDIIIRGGENISCAEVEASFLAHNPDILEAGCFGIKDARLGELVGLMVQLRPGSKLTAQEMVGRVKGKLAGFKIPLESSIFFTEAPLPRGATGKTLKREIRDTVNKELEQGKRVLQRAKL